MELELLDQRAVSDMVQNRYGAFRNAAGYRTDTIANICRKAAGLLCPLSARALRRAILGPLEVIGLTDVADSVGEVLDALVAQGDLLEIEEPNVGDRSRREILLYAAPPHFVPLTKTRYLILGVAPDDASLFPADLAQRIESVGSLRVLNSADNEDLAASLSELGLHEVHAEAWLRAPLAKSASDYVGAVDKRIERSGRAGAIPELLILDPNKPNNYYRGRWREAGKSSGRFVARRSRPYGGDIWCYVELQDGHPTRLTDLPHGRTEERGCDQAWRLQAAIDSVLDQPQQLAVRPVDDQHVQLAVFSPIPKWLVRRWESIGNRDKAEHCLLSYTIARDHLESEIKFAAERMWLQASSKTGSEQ